MVRRRVIAAIVAGATSALTACGGTGTHTQDDTPSPTASHTTSASTPTQPSTSSVSTSTTSKSVGRPLPTPSVTPPAQDAVNAFIAMLNLYNEASRDPQHAQLPDIDRYLTGKAKTIIDSSLTSMASSGYAYRGTPDDPRVKVKTSLGSFAQLTSCPGPSPTDPFVQYDVKTGKAVPVPTRTPPPPYLLTITVAKANGSWQVSDILQNAGATCHA